MTTGNPEEVPQADDQNRMSQVVDLLPAYALGALDDDERGLVDAALMESETVRDEYRRYQTTVDSLAAAISPTTPPGALRESILSTASASRPPIQLSSRRTTWLRVALGAAAAIILTLGAVAAFLWNELDQRDDQIAAFEQAASRPSRDFAQPLVWTRIDSASASNEGSGYYCRTEDGSVGWIIVEGMRTTSNDVYQLWLRDGDKLVSAGMFATDAEGRGFGVVRADLPLTVFHELWITLEPPGGSPAPTGDPAVSVNII